MEAKGGSTIFTEKIPKYGTVAMLFYIPETIDDRDTIVGLIKDNGGNIAKFHECIAFQLGPPEGASDHSYYPGLVYSYQWIVDSVEKSHLLEKENYILMNVESSAQAGNKVGDSNNIQVGMLFPFDKKKIQYTMREIIIIYNWITGRKSQASRKTWEGLGNEGILPCRSKESLKNFWKNWRNHTLESCLDNMVQKDLKYCHNYREPVYPHQELPEKRLKKGKRNRKEGVESSKGEGESELEESQNRRRNIKRKIKKMESDIQKPANPERAGKKDGSSKTDNLELNPVTALEDFDGEGEEEEDKQEEEKEDRDEHEAIKNNVSQKATKPEQPLEVESEDEDDKKSNKSSNPGFPVFGAESDDEGEGSAIKERAENLLNLFEGNE